MNCETSQRSLDDLHAGSLDAEQAAALRQHLWSCAQCRAFGEDVAHLRAALAAPAPPVPESLRASLRRYGRADSSRRVAGFAVAATIVIAVMLTGVWQQQKPLTEPAGVQMAWTPQPVSLALDSEQTLEGVQISLELPQGAHVEGHPGQRVLSWNDDLVAGTNRLTIPLMLQGEASGELVARIEHEGRSREIRISLNALRSGSNGKGS